MIFLIIGSQNLIGFGGFFQRLFGIINFQKKIKLLYKKKNYYHVLFDDHFLIRFC